MGTPNSKPNWKSEFVTMSEGDVLGILSSCLTEMRVMTRHLKGFEAVGYYGGRSPWGSQRLCSPESFGASHRNRKVIEASDKAVLVCELSRLPKNSDRQITAREIWLTQKGELFFWLTRYTTEARGGRELDKVSEMSFETVRLGGPGAQPDDFFFPFNRREIMGEAIWKIRTLFDETARNRRLLLEKVVNGMARVDRTIETICELTENS